MTFGGACRRQGLALLFLVGAVPLGFGADLRLHDRDAVAALRAGFEIDGPVHRYLALAITTGIFLLSLAALLSGREKIESETYNVPL